MKISDLGLMAAAVYEEPGSDGVPGASRIKRHNAAGTAWDAFQAAAYSMGNEIAVVFRGTSCTGDGITDVALGLGMNSAYYDQAEDFAREYAYASTVVCGHSLGGAIAQVVANRMGLPMVTFNAPGVAVVASRNIASANLRATKVRMVGMVASAIVRPAQAWRDVMSAFTTVRGVNLCLSGDLVSQIGVHYGTVERIPGLTLNPIHEHKMDTVNAVLENHSIGNRIVSL